MKRFFQITLCFAVFSFFGVTSLSAQKIKLTKGDFAALVGQEKINVVYDYSDMSVGKYKKEEEYLNDKQKEKNEKESGTGDTWRTGWEADRENRFEPKFAELMNKYLEDYDMMVGSYESADYTIVLKTDHTEPGFNVGIVRRPAHINTTIYVVKTSSLNDDLSVKDKDAEAIVTMEKVPGTGAMGYDFDTGLRIQETYAKCGKELAKLMEKKNLKKAKKK